MKHRNLSVVRMGRVALLMCVALVWSGVSFAGPWVNQVTVGGQFASVDCTQNLSIAANEGPDGEVRGQYEYANETQCFGGGQGWRYHGEVECLLVDGDKAVVVGPITIEQQLDPPDAWVVFIVEDSGPGAADSMNAFFAAPDDCSNFEFFLDAPTPFVDIGGNVSVRTR